MEAKGDWHKCTNLKFYMTLKLFWDKCKIDILVWGFGRINVLKEKFKCT